MEEIWKQVPSIEGMLASNLGRVKLPERYVKLCNGGKYLRTTKPVIGNITKANKLAKHTYRGIYSRVHGNLKVHRLVCEAFHGLPPFPKSVVIHLNEDALDNRAENLKWGTQKENLNMPKFIEYCKSRKGENSSIHKHRIKKSLEI